MRSSRCYCHQCSDWIVLIHHYLFHIINIAHLLLRSREKVQTDPGYCQLPNFWRNVFHYRCTWCVSVKLLLYIEWQLVAIYWLNRPQWDTTIIVATIGGSQLPFSREPKALDLFHVMLVLNPFSLFWSTLLFSSSLFWVPKISSILYSIQLCWVLTPVMITNSGCEAGVVAVSYTHLTLPTICSV